MIQCPHEGCEFTSSASSIGAHSASCRHRVSGSNTDLYDKFLHLQSELEQCKAILKRMEREQGHSSDLGGGVAHKRKHKGSKAGQSSKKPHVAGGERHRRDRKNNTQEPRRPSKSSGLIEQLRSPSRV